MDATRVALACLFAGALCLSCSETKQETAAPKPVEAKGDFRGSVSCRECHERFYGLWATSHHGLAMQPFTTALAQTKLTPQQTPIAVGDHQYRVDGAVMHEDGPDGAKQYPILHAMGGKNVYYFLTELDRGRLQVLPLAYDVRMEKWIDATGSMVRHVADEPVPWTDPLLTFNTSCHSCHVSQLSTNYDPKTDTYHTTWAEPGINCETCHGPGGEHVEACKALPEGQAPEDLKLLSYKSLTIEQTNDTCAPCHAKGGSLGVPYQPGDRYFDHHTLTAFENADYYPDGRDLGENYTHTLWLTSACAKSGKLSCTHCHTSSGRYRFAKENPNGACLPCHQERVDNAVAHHRHPAGKGGSRCIDCHIPKTTFARMARSDHSMKPPTPAATLAFKSPNACNICHTDKDAKWADALVREWHKDDYQAPVLARARLVDDARKQRWGRLDDMLAAVVDPKHDPVWAVSLVRLLAPCGDPRKWPALVAATKSKSPLVRAAAMAALGPARDRRVLEVLLAGTADEYRIVRFRATAALASVPQDVLAPADRQRMQKANAELLAALRSRADDWAAHYNLGNFLSERGELRRAVNAFARAAELRPGNIMPLVNASMAHAQLGENRLAEHLLRRALQVEPTHVAANLNFGLLMAEQGDKAAAERAFRTALATEPTFAQAAYNLGILLAPSRLDEGVDWCRKAHKLRPEEPRYAYTLAFYLVEGKKLPEAATILRDVVKRNPDYGDACVLLGDVCERQGKKAEAMAVYRAVLKRGAVEGQQRRLIEGRLRRLMNR